MTPPYAAAQLLADYLRDMPCLLGVEVDNDDATTKINNGKKYLLVYKRPGTDGPPEGSEKIPKKYLGYRVYSTCLVVPGRTISPDEDRR